MGAEAYVLYMLLLPAESDQVLLHCGTYVSVTRDSAAIRAQSTYLAQTGSESGLENGSSRGRGLRLELSLCSSLGGGRGRGRDVCLSQSHVLGHCRRDCVLNSHGLEPYRQLET